MLSNRAHCAGDYQCAIGQYFLQSQQRSQKDVSRGVPTATNYTPDCGHASPNSVDHETEFHCFGYSDLLGYSWAYQCVVFRTVCGRGHFLSRASIWPLSQWRYSSRRFGVIRNPRPLKGEIERVWATTAVQGQLLCFHDWAG